MLARGDQDAIKSLIMKKDDPVLVSHGQLGCVRFHSH